MWLVASVPDAIALDNKLLRTNLGRRNLGQRLLLSGEQRNPVRPRIGTMWQGEGKGPGDAGRDGGAAGEERACRLKGNEKPLLQPGEHHQQAYRYQVPPQRSTPPFSLSHSTLAPCFSQENEAFRKQGDSPSHKSG
jgi:hypothetical protein